MKEDRDFRIAMRQWAIVNRGWHGAQGGWIYTAAGRPVTQGWVNVWFRNKTEILDWLTKQETAFSSFKEMVEGTAPTYRPTIYQTNARRRVLTTEYDYEQQRRGDRRRVHRGYRMAS